MSSTRKRAPARRARARRARGSSARRRRTSRRALEGALAVLRALRPRELDQRSRDIVGLVLLAVGTYLYCTDCHSSSTQKASERTSNMTCDTARPNGESRDWTSSTW